jgi:DNA-binding GntR family transcriptional regulator
VATKNGWIEALGQERTALGRASTAGRVADVLRTHITEGLLEPGTRLSEEDIGAALGVSRNTLREAFRLLTHERLLVHEFNRGVFVRSLSVDDVRDLYSFRRIVECGAIAAQSRLRRDGGGAAPGSALLLALLEAVEEGEVAAADGRWADVGTANMQFHRAVAALAESPRINESMRHVLAELRLVFHVMAAPQTFHEPYLADNRRILELLEAGDLDAAERELATYLDTAEAQLADAYAVGTQR